MSLLISGAGVMDMQPETFRAWARKAKCPYEEKTARERTAPELVDDILIPIKEFPSQLVTFTEHYSF